MLRGEGSDPTLSPMQRERDLAKEVLLSQGNEAHRLN